MATSSTETTIAVPAFDATTKGAREADDRLVELGRGISTAYLDDIEQPPACSIPTRS